MYISRIVIRNFRNFMRLDVPLKQGVTCIIGENNTGKSNFLFALRLAIDSSLSSTYRMLSEHDIHSGISIADPMQVLVCAEFSDYFDKVNETALVGCWEVDDVDHVARLTYRFRPRPSTRDSLENGEIETGNLTIDDYHWELTGGGEIDPLILKWNEDMGAAVRFSDLQQFHVVFLHALRDVNQDLRTSRQSPLARLIDSSEIPETEKIELVDILRNANEEISKRDTINKTGEAIQAAFQSTSGEAFQMAVRLGMADPSFTSIARSLTVLLSDNSLTDFETYRNGLGLNNILYMSMLIESFERRAKLGKAAGQILLVEEPEAHLHPQLQRVLLGVLKEKPFQTILTSHSTHITSNTDLQSLVLLTNSGLKSTSGRAPGAIKGLSKSDIADLERYLDATRSTLLYARKVILVEGPAELFVIPPLVKKVLKIDLERYGVSVVPIYGVHFDVYAKIFNNGLLNKKCAIIADGDLKPSDAQEIDAEDGSCSYALNLQALKGKFVEVFQCKTTFELELTMPGLLECLASAFTECGSSKLAGDLRSAHQALASQGGRKPELLPSLQTRVLSSAKRTGKARFAQILSRHLDKAQSMPAYIMQAVKWLDL